ncbi:MAG: hypothetical protein LCH61_12390 [Proteobacteria bacterium]|nr:hypothetical protein [Pseudomonadota bacterium]
MNTSYAKGFEEAHKLALETPTYPQYDIARTKRSYALCKGNGRFGGAAFEAALERAVEAEPIPSSEITGDCFDAAALAISWIEKRDTPFQNALAQLARELAVVAGRAEVAGAGDVFLKFMLLSRWLDQPAMPFATEISSFLAQMIARDCEELGLDPESIRLDAEKAFPNLAK